MAVSVFHVTRPGTHSAGIILATLDSEHTAQTSCEKSHTHTHRMHVIKVQISLSVCIFRTMPAWLNCPEISMLHVRPVKHVVGMSNSKLIAENNINDVQKFNCGHLFGSFNQPVCCFAELWPGDLVWDRHVNAAAGRKTKRRKWEERSEISLFIHRMPSFLVLVMIVLIFLIQCDPTKGWNHRKRTNEIRWRKIEVWSLKNSDPGWIGQAANKQIRIRKTEF